MDNSESSWGWGSGGRGVFQYASSPGNLIRLKAHWYHDLKHTFGRRLRAAGVSLEDRHDLLGHRSGRVTTHDSPAELGNLIGASNVCEDRSRKSPARA